MQSRSQSPPPRKQQTTEAALGNGSTCMARKLCRNSGSENHGEHDVRASDSASPNLLEQWRLLGLMNESRLAKEARWVLSSVTPKATRWNAVAFLVIGNGLSRTTFVLHLGVWNFIYHEHSRRAEPERQQRTTLGRSILKMIHWTLQAINGLCRRTSIDQIQLRFRKHTMGDLSPHGTYDAPTHIGFNTHSKLLSSDALLPLSISTFSLLNCETNSCFWAVCFSFMTVTLRTSYSARTTTENLRARSAPKDVHGFAM